MHEEIQNWLGEKIKISGVLACGVRFPDRKTYTRNQSAQFEPVALENACRCLADTFQVIHSNHFAVEHLRWIFGGYFVYGSMRDDGACFSFITRREDSPLKTDAVNHLLEEFKKLQA
ncbi:hypothetical protein [Pedosphaera parvula]|uniref:Roadblock/LC7 family protein n=1 Tax=Pedosphaera parvula (strain Ellin514) TaxID=320771 RepID=B9XHF8_PEDPL|nr:hypothetical protein [Pedosphaera parvula]EEF60793.1 hypothetical protein Cflav_PD3651 [Pedosphaera parvula Ellin514]